MYLQCPRCHLMLFVGTASGAAVHACGRCGGLWLDAQASARVERTHCAETMRLAESASKSAALPIDTAPMLACPVCHMPLSRTRIAQAWLDVDRCAAHGTWFDRDELARVARALSIPAVGDWRHAAPPPVAAPSYPRSHHHDDADDDDAITGAAVGFAVMEVLLDAVFD
jgi:Zn-finger nucleic acid-binding protein